MTLANCLVNATIKYPCCTSFKRPGTVIYSKIPHLMLPTGCKYTASNVIALVSKFRAVTNHDFFFKYTNTAAEEFSWAKGADFAILNWIQFDRIKCSYQTCFLIIMQIKLSLLQSQWCSGCSFLCTLYWILIDSYR